MRVKTKNHREGNNLNKNMKLKLIIMLLTLSVSFANAQLRIAPITPASRNLIDLTRGGFSPQQGLPPAYFKLIDQTFFDEAAHGVFELPGQPPQDDNQWISMFGDLDGGTYFFTNLFTLPLETPSALIWWNFTGEPNGYHVTMILVEGQKADGTAWANIYRVPPGHQIRSIGESLVTLDGMASIYSISFWGDNR